jgi:putative membrane protein
LSWRIGARSFAVVAALVLTQAVLVLVWLATFGVSPVHHVGSVLVVLGISLAFVLLHQGLVALFGRVGWVISLAFIALQLAAVGTLFVHAGADNPVQSLVAGLPLAQATRALQALAAGEGGWA